MHPFIEFACLTDFSKDSKLGDLKTKVSKFGVDFLNKHRGGASAVSEYIDKLINQLIAPLEFVNGIFKDDQLIAK